MCVEELNRVNQRLKPRNVKEMMLKAGSYVPQSRLFGKLELQAYRQRIQDTGLQLCKLEKRI